MFKCVGLNKQNLILLKDLNEHRKTFNELNADFFEDYSSLGYVKQSFLIKRINLIKYKSEYVGYSWINPTNRSNSIINSINFEKGVDINKAFNFLITSNQSKSNLSYLCLKNDFNFKILEASGFKKGKGTLEMATHIEEVNDLTCDENVTFQVFQKGVHEKIRCELQNELFENSSRIPLTVQDIYIDELQTYYYNKGSIFIKYKDAFIGFGQVIFECDYPTIVNFGILKKYRNCGFGKMLLNHLFSVILKYNYNYVFIKVKSDNEAAIKLYKSCGFQISKESYTWILNRT